MTYYLTWAFRTSILFLFPLFGLFAESFEASTLYLTWKKSPSTTMTLQWLTKSDNTTTPTIRYHKALDSQWHIEQGKKQALAGFGYDLNQVELHNLDPSTFYTFRLGLETDEFQFLTMPSDLTHPIHFIVGGDMQHDSIRFMEATSRQAAKTHPYFAVIGGDIAYACATQRDLGSPKKWVSWIQSWHRSMRTPEGRLIPVIAAIGNHDLVGGFNQTPQQAKIFSTLFPMPGEQIYNTLDFGNYLTLFLLDSGHAHSVEGKQADWLKNELRVRENVPHKFPIYHVPAYPSIRSYGNDKCSVVREAWTPIFELAGIRVVFEHHDHAYKRTFPLLEGKIHPKGVVYTGDGAWGIEKPRQIRSSNRPFYLEKLSSKRHFIMVVLDGESEYFVAIDDEGNKIDEWGLKLHSKLDVEKV